MPSEAAIEDITTSVVPSSLNIPCTQLTSWFKAPTETLSPPMTYSMARLIVLALATSSYSIATESQRDDSESLLSLLVHRTFISDLTPAAEEIEPITSTMALFVTLKHSSFESSGLLSRNASLSSTMVECDASRTRLSAVPEWKILSFSNLNGMMATEITVLASFAALQTIGPIAVPARPARFETMIIVGKPRVAEAISSQRDCTKDRSL